MKITTKKENFKLFDQAEKTHLKIKERIARQASNSYANVKGQPKRDGGRDSMKGESKLAFN